MITFLLWVLSMFYTNLPQTCLYHGCLRSNVYFILHFSVLRANIVLYIVLDAPDQHLEGAQCWLLCKMAFLRFRENLAYSTVSVCVCVCLCVCVCVLSVSLCMCIGIFVCVLYVSLCECVSVCVYLGVSVCVYVFVCV